MPDSDSDSASAEAARYRVLVVEQDSREASKLVDLLESSFDVSVASTGAEALESLRRGGAHVVCASGRVPGMDPVTFLRRALSVPSPPCFLMIASAGDMKDEQLEGLSGVIMKPYDDEALVARVQRLSRVAETRRRVESAREAIQKHMPGSRAPGDAY